MRTWGQSDGPAGWVLAGPWCACWRGGGQSVVTSVTAARALCSSTMFLRPAMAATRAWVARLLTARGRPRAASWIRVTASSLNRGSDAAGELEVVGDVAGGLLGGHGGHGVAEADALVEGGQDAEAEHAAQGGLADEQAGQRAGRVHLGVGQDPDGLELVVGQEMGLVDDQDGDPAALVVLGGEQAGGLGGEGGGAVGGPAAERGDHLVVDAPGAGGRIGQVDQGVPGLVERGDGGAGGDRLARSRLRP